MNKKDIKRLLEDNFAYLQGLTVKEYTMYRKWVDIQERYPYEQNDFFDDDPYERLLSLKDNIWIPQSVDDYKNLKPRMILSTNSAESFIWNTLRDFCHSAVWHQSPGRLLRYFVIDENTEKYLGFISLGSDFIGVGGRDKHIGWTTEDKLKKKKLRHTAMGSSIAAVQPFGYNYNGGKLMAMLTASEVVQNHWLERYNEKLVGVTTTSLYGGGSMYNRLVNWRKCTSTTGEIALEPSEDVYNVLKTWYKENFEEEYRKAIKGSHPKTRVLGLIYKELGVKPPINNAPRGVYWNELYVDTKDFLCDRISDVTKKKYDNSVETLTEIWKERYAKKRVENLTKDERFSDEVLFYYDMITENWNDIKSKYLDEIT